MTNNPPANEEKSAHEALKESEFGQDMRESLYSLGSLERKQLEMTNNPPTKIGVSAELRHVVDLPGDGRIYEDSFSEASNGWTVMARRVKRYSNGLGGDPWAVYWCMYARLPESLPGERFADVPLSVYWDLGGKEWGGGYITFHGTPQHMSGFGSFKHYEAGEWIGSDSSGRFIGAGDDIGLDKALEEARGIAIQADGLAESHLSDEDKGETNDQS